MKQISAGGKQRSNRAWLTYVLMVKLNIFTHHCLSLRRSALCAGLLLALNTGYADDERVPLESAGSPASSQADKPAQNTLDRPAVSPPLPGESQFGVGYESRFGARREGADQSVPETRPRPWAFWRNRSEAQRPGLAHPERPARPDRPLRPERPERIERPLPIERPDRPPRPEIIRPSRP